MGLIVAEARGRGARCEGKGGGDLRRRSLTSRRGRLRWVRSPLPHGGPSVSASDPATITAPGIEEAVRKKLQDASNPLKLSEVIKGLPKPKKSKKAPPAPDLGEEARKVLEE